MQGPLASPIRVRTVVARCTCKLTVLERSVLDGMRQEFPLLDAILAEIEIPPEPVSGLLQERLAGAAYPYVASKAGA